MGTIPDHFDRDTYYLFKGTHKYGEFDDSWNDYSFHTIYTLWYFDSSKAKNEIGRLKLGQFGMGEGMWSPDPPDEFSTLDPSRFFSLGIGHEYYRNIVDIEDGKGYDLLDALVDFTLRPDVYSKARDEQVVQKSLLRDDNEDTIQEYLRLLNPPLNLTTMYRVYGSTGWDDIDAALVQMQHRLYSAESNLDYNAIAVIGRQILKGMADRLYDDDVHRDKAKYKEAPRDDQFINKLCGIVEHAVHAGEINKNIADYIKSTITLVQGYVHKKRSEGYECFMMVHAVITLVYQISIITKMDEYNKLIGKDNT
jgi:hypothetical protein